MRNSIRATISVSYEHQVHFTNGAFGPENDLLKDVLSPGGESVVTRAIVILDGSLVAARPGLIKEIADYFSGHKTRIALAGEPMVVSGGESVKNTEVAVQRIYSEIERNHLCRHSCVIAIGGGALLDVAGFAAATAHRGLRHVRMPTTVLSQNDAGVGVKNGINAFGKKNFIGTFAPPTAVINDFELIDSLPPREKRAGCIEAVKVALIRDGAFFDLIEQNIERIRQFEPAAMEDLIYRCADAHVRHIATSGDPFEMGSARPLDFGHWAAHKLEQVSDFKIHHGEAVAIGIALDVIYSELSGFLDKPASGRILKLIAALGFDLYADELVSKDAQGNLVMLNGLEEFREHLGGRLTVTLLRGIGRGFEVHEMDTDLIRQAIERLRKYSHPV